MDKVVKVTDRTAKVADSATKVTDRTARVKDKSESDG